MQILLDTHAFIWFINGDQLLPGKVIDTIKNIENRCFISIASIWEIAIKTSLNKLQLESDLNAVSAFLNANDIEILPITFEHILHLNKLPYHHNDPFDRIIIAQSLIEKLTIVTKDEAFKLYESKIIW